jgi:hypothetical protein
MEIIRLVVAGAVGTGKSTFVRTIGEMGAISIDRIATDEVAFKKRSTTVAFDFSQIVLRPGLSLHVYGTPGQSRFNFMWDILIRKAHFYLLLIATHRPGDLSQTQEIMRFMSERSQVPMVIGLTHLDCPGALSRQKIAASLGFYEVNTQPLILNVNPRDRRSVLSTLTAALNVLTTRASR